ncbi:MAG: hypothetical protein Q8M95_16935 [Candidatus Methanoperedens sp.]|nr:hypothetical protein [Candidatus Methanoperedens sp.]
MKHSDKKYGLNGFMNENANVNIRGSVVQRSNLGENKDERQK